MIDRIENFESVAMEQQIIHGNVVQMQMKVLGILSHFTVQHRWTDVLSQARTLHSYKVLFRVELIGFFICLQQTQHVGDLFTNF